MTEQQDSPTPGDAPKLRRTLVTGAPVNGPKVRFNSPATQGETIQKPRFLTPQLKAKLEQEQAVAAQEAARQVAEQEAQRIAAEQEVQRLAEQKAAEDAARIAAEQEAARIAAVQEAARIAAEQEAQRLVEQKAVEEAARVAAEQEAARIAAEQEAQRITAEPAVEPQVAHMVAKQTIAAKLVSGQPGTNSQTAIQPATNQNSEASVADSTTATSVEQGQSTQQDLQAQMAMALAQIQEATRALKDAQAKAVTQATVKLAKSRIPAAVAKPPTTPQTGPLRNGTSAVTSASNITGTSNSAGSTTQPSEENQSEPKMPISVEPANKLLKVILWIVGGLVVATGIVLFFVFRSSSEKEEIESRNARITELVQIGAQLGEKNLYSVKMLKERGKNVFKKINPNVEDAKLLLANIRGEKGYGTQKNWPGAAHLVSIMAQMNDDVARLVIDDMKKHAAVYSTDQYKMMITLLAQARNATMRKLLRDLFDYVRNSKDKKIVDKQALVLKYMRNALTLDDLDDVLQYLTQEDAKQDLMDAATRAARQIIDNTKSKEKRKALSATLLKMQDKVPTNNSKLLYKLLARTGDPKVLDMMKEIYKKDNSKAISVFSSWGDWSTDDVLPYLVESWHDESLPERARAEAHHAILRVISIDRDRNDEAMLHLIDPLIEHAKTSEERRRLVSAFKRLSNRPFVTRVLAKIKTTAEKQRDAYEPLFRKVEDELFKAEDKAKAAPGDKALQEAYQAKEKSYNELRNKKQGEDEVISDVDKALEKVEKTSVPKKAVKSKDDEDSDDDLSDAIKQKA